MLQLKNIHKTYASAGMSGGKGKKIKALIAVDFNLDEDESVALVGESGCGKTTLARIAMNLLMPDSGEVFFRSRKINFREIKQRREFYQSVQMVFQDPYSSLDPRFTIVDILREAFFLADKRNKKEEENIMKQTLHSVGMPENILGRFPHEFSGGERQRIAIARALIVSPKILILDEAVSSLDVIIQKQIMDLLLKLKNEYQLTYLFISHNLKILRRFSQRIAVMYKGRLIESASADELFINPVHPYTRALLAAAVNYKTIGVEKEDFYIDGQLQEIGNGHMVLKN